MNTPPRPTSIQPSISNPADARKLADALMRISKPSHLHVLPIAAPAKPPVHEVRRDVPAHNWLAMGAVSLLTCVLMVGVWERHVRAIGYEPDYDDTPSLWVKQRQKASGARSNQLVLVGASRTLYDLDLDRYEWTNLARDARFAAIKAGLARQLPATDAPEIEPARPWDGSELNAEAFKKFAPQAK